jgi:REP element-mobilizing transposase RayT
VERRSVNVVLYSRRATMPRKPRIASQTGYYHFINRGINKRKIFHKKNDFEFYLRLALEYKDKFGIEISHYCIMSNHSHFQLKTDCLDNLLTERRSVGRP